MSHKPQGVRNISSKGKSPRVRRGSLALSKEVLQQVTNAVDTDAVYEDVQFKEQELKRRVDLKAITSHETLSSLQRGQAGLRKSAYYGYNGQQRGMKTPRSTREAIAWADFEETENAVNEQPWFEKVRMYAAGVTEAETTIVQNEVMQNETQLMRTWATEAKGLVKLRADESNTRDEKYMQEVEGMIDEIEINAELDFLAFEGIAAVVNRKERARLQHKHKQVAIQYEQRKLAELMQSRKDMGRGLYERSLRRNSEALQVFSEGPKLLTQFGNLLEKVCKNLIQSQKGELMLRLHEEGLDVGRFKATDAANKASQVITDLCSEQETNTSTSASPQDYAQRTRHVALTLALER